jgi:predicted dehydrogenase
MGHSVRIAVVGIGGHGEVYLRELLDRPADDKFCIVAGIDPAAEKSGRYQDLQQLGVPLFASLEAFYESGGDADLVMIVSPIHFHRAQTELALAHGASVLCEKPLCATVQDALAMAAAEQAAEGFVAIGYQWSYSTAIQTLKTDIMAGLLGRPRQARTLACWPRGASYYARNRWAGSLRSGDGEWVLDSPINNAVAHYLHNMFYLMGATRETSAVPQDVIAELYRANEITNYDTGMLRAHTEDGVEILFVASHTVPSNIGPLTHIRFENADVYTSPEQDRFFARFKDGRVKDYGTTGDGRARKVWESIDAVRTGATPVCGIAAAMSQTLCMNGAQESAGRIVDVPPELIETLDGDNPITTVRGMLPLTVQCHELGLLPSELGSVSWASPGRPVDLSNYTMFPSHT